MRFLPRLASASGLWSGLFLIAMAAASVRADPPSASAGIAGVVTDEKGAPIVGAQVEAYDDFAHLRRLARHEALEDPRPLEPAARATADAQGRFRLAGLRSQRHMVVARAPGRGAGFLQGVPAVAEGGPEVSLPLGPGATVSGEVIDAEGKGIAGALVAVGVGFETMEVPWRESVFGRAFGTTDAEGRFRVEGVPTVLPLQHGDHPVKSYSVCVLGPGPTLCERSFDEGLPTGAVKMRFGGGLVVRGAVRTQGGESVPGARVVVSTRIDEPQGRSTYLATTTSGADGAYRVAGLRPSEPKVVEAYAGSAGVGVGSPRGDGPPDDPTAIVDVVLMPPAVVTGAFTRPDASPAAGVEVFLTTRGGATWSGSTDPAGRWRIDGLPHLPLVLTVDRGPDILPSASRSVKFAKDAAEANLEVRLVAPARVAGRVLDPAGKPVSRARVTVEGADRRERLADEAVTGPDGTFLHPDLEAQDVVLIATHASCEDPVEWHGRLEAGRSVSGLEIRLPARLPDLVAALEAGAPTHEIDGGIQALIAVLGSSDPFAPRSRAAKRLGDLGPRAKDAVPALVALVKDASLLSRDAGVALAAIGEVAAASLASVLSGPDGGRRVPAAEALARFEPLPPSARPAVVEGARGGDPLLRVACVRALAHAKPADAATVGALVAILAARDVECLAVAFDAILELAPRDASVGEALRPYLADDEWAGHALRAAKALGPAAAPLVPGVLRRVRAGKGRSDDAVAVLVAVGQPAVAALVSAVRQAGNADAVRDALFRALSGLRSASVLALLELAGDPDADVRARALGALAGVWPHREPVVAALTAALGDADAGVRRAAVRRLGRLGALAAPATPALVGLLSSDDPEVRHEVASALYDMGPAAGAAFHALQGLTSDADPDVRQRALQALSRLGDASVPVLLKALRSETEPEVRLSAAMALGWQGAVAREAVPDLAAFLDDPEPRVRGRAAGALAEIGPDARGASERLARLAKDDEDAEVRLAASLALAAQAEPPAAVALLRPFLEAGFAGDKDAVARRVRRLGPAAGPLVPDILRVVGDPRGSLHDSDRATWIGALGALGPAGAAVEAPLVAILEDRKTLYIEVTRKSAAVTLLELGRRLDLALPAAIAVLDEDTPVPIVARAARAVGALGPKADAAAPALERLLDSFAPVEREAALEALLRVTAK